MIFTHWQIPLFENMEMKMHDVQIPHERLQTALRSGNVAELAPKAASLTNGEHSLSQPSRPTVNQQSEQKNFSFEQVREQVQSDDKGKWDIVLPRSEVLMREGKLIFPECKAYECEDGVTPLPWATGQICQRLNIPTSYFRRCPAHLQDLQFNFWNAKNRSELRRDMENQDANSHAHENGYDYFDGEATNIEAFNPSEPQEYQNGWPQGPSNGHKFKNGIYAGTEKSEYWLLRAKGENLRAVLTDRYTPLDNRTLLDGLHKTLPPHLQVQWLALDDESFHLRLIDPTLSHEVFDGDPLMAGIHISNSETGRRSVTIDSILYRQVCANGLIKMVRGKSILSQRHVAVSPPHFGALLRQSLATALSTAGGFLEQMVWATTEPIRDMETETKSLMQHWHLSQGFVEQVKESLQRERSDQQETVFGLVNAMTQAAQSLDAEMRYDMEVLASKWLDRKSVQSLKAAPQSRPVSVPVALPDAPHGNSNQGNSKVAEAIEAAEVLFEAEQVNSEAKQLEAVHESPNGQARHQ